MEFLAIFAGIGQFAGDLFAILSVIGSVILFIGALFASKSPMRKFGKMAEWAVIGLVLGVVGQVSMAITGTTPQEMGILVRMSPLMVDALLALSFVLLVGRWWVRKNRPQVPVVKKRYARASQRVK